MIYCLIYKGGSKVKILERILGVMECKFRYNTIKKSFYDVEIGLESGTSFISSSYHIDFASSGSYDYVFDPLYHFDVSLYQSGELDGGSSYVIDLFISTILNKYLRGLKLERIIDNG